MKKLYLWVITFICLSATFFLQGCAMDKPFVQKDYLTTISSIKVVRYETPNLREPTLGKALIGAALAGGVGAFVASRIGKHEVNLDFGQLVMNKFTNRIKNEIPNFPAMNVEDKPVQKNFTCECPLIEFEVTNLWIGYMGLLRGGGYGLFTETTVRMKDNHGNLLWRKKFKYTSADFKRSVSSTDELKKDNNKLLMAELDFAAEKTVSIFIEHLKAAK